MEFEGGGGDGYPRWGHSPRTESYSLKYISRGSTPFIFHGGALNSFIYISYFGVEWWSSDLGSHGIFWRSMHYSGLILNWWNGSNRGFPGIMGGMTSHLAHCSTLITVPLNWLNLALNSSLNLWCQIIHKLAWSWGWNNWNNHSFWEWVIWMLCNITHNTCHYTIEFGISAKILHASLLATIIQPIHAYLSAGDRLCVYKT